MKYSFSTIILTHLSFFFALFFMRNTSIFSVFSELTGRYYIR